MACKSKKAEPQARAREQRRQMKWKKYRRKSRGTAHGPRPTRQQHEVAKRLLAGEVAMGCGTGWSFVEPFLAFLGEVGFFDILRIDPGDHVALSRRGCPDRHRAQVVAQGKEAQ